MPKRVASKASKFNRFVITVCLYLAHRGVLASEAGATSKQHSGVWSANADGTRARQMSVDFQSVRPPTAQPLPLKNGTSARPAGSSRTNSMSARAAYNVGQIAGREKAPRAPVRPLLS